MDGEGTRYDVDELRAALQELVGLPATAALTRLIDAGLDQLPLPAGGATLLRWQALAAVAAHDLSLAKLFEGHTDALAILSELRADVAPGSWGTWAAEPPGMRVYLQPAAEGAVLLSGRKAWCSGAADVEHGLLTAWRKGAGGEDQGPYLVAVAMRQHAVHVEPGGWSAVGMSGSAGLDLRFDDAVGRPVGSAGDYLHRPGFWYGGAGVAACWYGAAAALAQPLRLRLARGIEPHAAAHLGAVDVALAQYAALLRQTATWIDRHPLANAQLPAMRVRAAAERTATRVLDHVGRALGAAPFCMDADFARRAADLPVFLRQSHAERDLQALAEALPAPTDADADELWAL